MNRALIVFLLTGCVTQVPRTQVIVEIDAEPSVLADATNLHVTVLGGERGGTLTMQADQVLGGGIPWPVTVALAPAGADPDRVFTVEGVATNATGATIGIVRASSSYVAGRTLTLRLTLEDCCRTVAPSCSAEETCRSCGCESAEVLASSLTDWSPDAGSMVMTDGAVSPDTSDVMLPDAGMPDAEPTRSRPVTSPRRCGMRPPAASA